MTPKTKRRFTRQEKEQSAKKWKRSVCTIQRYIAQGVDITSDDEMTLTVKRRSTDDAEIVDARNRKTIADADLAETKVEIERRKLKDLEENHLEAKAVNDLIDQIKQNIKVKLETVPSDLAPSLVDKDACAIKTTLENAVVEILQDLRGGL